VTLGQEVATARRGDTVVLTSLGVEVESQGNRFPTGKWFRAYTVREVQGDRLFVSAETGYPTGWVDCKDVVPLQKANDYFSKKIQLSSGSARAQSLAIRGSLRASYLGERANGVYDLIQARQLDPNIPLIYMSLGSLCLQKGDYGGAEGEFDEAIRLDSSSAPAHLMRGHTFCCTNKFDQALADLNEAIRLEPSNGYLYSRRAVVWRSLSKMDRGLVDFETGIRLAPESSWAYTDRGTIHIEREEYERAVIAFDKAINWTTLPTTHSLGEPSQE
jgi:tetratricopeptide (TPR) repeat protein